MIGSDNTNVKISLIKVLYICFFILFSIPTYKVFGEENKLLSDLCVEEVPVYHSITEKKSYKILEDSLTNIYEFLIINLDDKNDRKGIDRIVHENSENIRKHKELAVENLKKNNIVEAEKHYYEITQQYISKIVQLNAKYPALLENFHKNSAIYLMKKYGKNFEYGDINYKVSEKDKHQYNIHLTTLGYYAYYLLKNVEKVHKQPADKVSLKHTKIDQAIAVDINNFDIMKVGKNIFITITWSHKYPEIYH